MPRLGYAAKQARKRTNFGCDLTIVGSWKWKLWLIRECGDRGIWLTQGKLQREVLYVVKHREKFNK